MRFGLALAPLNLLNTLKNWQRLGSLRCSENEEETKKKPCSAELGNICLAIFGKIEDESLLVIELDNRTRTRIKHLYDSHEQGVVLNHFKLRYSASDKNTFNSICIYIYIYLFMYIYIL